VADLLDFGGQRPLVVPGTQPRRVSEQPSLHQVRVERAHTVHFAFTQGHPAKVNTNIYYASYRRGFLWHADGRPIKRLADLPLRPREADTVYDGRDKAWVHDVAYDASGRPVIVFATIDAAGEHSYRYARWDGRRWRVHFITPAGRSIADNGAEPYYSGGVTLDHENPSVVYLSRYVDGTFEVETWRTPDRGASWRHWPITSGSSTENVRPVSPRGLLPFDDDLSVLWMRGKYVHFVDYRTDLTTTLLNGGNRPPLAEANATPRSGKAPLEVHFDASRSRDGDGSVVRWAWAFGDGTRAEGPTPVHAYRKRGRYFATLTVTDGAGDSDRVVVEVGVR
jgi:hypothetical protein